MNSSNRSVGQPTGTILTTKYENRRSAWFLLAIALLLLLPSRAAFAQYDTGGLVGTIRDSSGSAVPNVTITVTNDATGVATVVKTNDSGDYEVPSLHVGVYTISASATGFAIAEAKSITLSVGARERIDLTLKVGAAQATTVEVSDVALQLETDSSQRDQTITGYQSSALPLVSRNYTDLLALVTGVRQAPTQATTTTNINSPVRAGAYNVNGQRSMFNNFLLDGMDNNAYGESNQGFDNQIIAVPPDSVADFSVVTNNESAEYGRGSAATVNVASKSGGNQFHALVYEFLRNTDLNAAGFFKPTTIGTNGPVPFRKPTSNRNQFGGNFGGPILRDKMFFFLDYEGLRAITKPLYVLTLPTQNELNGNLVVAVTNPVTGTSLSRQHAHSIERIRSLVCSNRGSVQKHYRLAALRLCNDRPECRRLLGADTLPRLLRQGRFAPGLYASPSARYFLRVSDHKETAINFPTIPLPLEGQVGGYQRILDQQIALGYTGSFGANRLLDLRLGISRTKAGKTPIQRGNSPRPGEWCADSWPR